MLNRGNKKNCLAPSDYFPIDLTWHKFSTPHLDAGPGADLRIVPQAIALLITKSVAGPIRVIVSAVGSMAEGGKEKARIALAIAAHPGGG